MSDVAYQKSPQLSYQDKPWLENYDPGIPKSKAPYPDQPVHELLDEAAASHPNNPASIMSARLPLLGRQEDILTYGELNDLSDRLAAGLAAMGIQKGDRVAVFMPNITQFVISFFGILKAGATLVAINPTYPAPKLAQQLNNSGAETIIVMSRFYELADSVRDQTPLKRIILTNIKEYLPSAARVLYTLARERKEGDRVDTLNSSEDVWLQDILSKYSPSQRPQVEFEPAKDVALLQYTGGTTGVPKGARATHKGLVANALQMSSWLQSSEKSKENPSFLAAAPFFHVYGLVAVLIFAVKNSAPMYMVPNPRDTVDVMDQIDHFEPTIYMGVPALYNAINQHPDMLTGKYDLSSIEACISGSAPLAPDTKRRFEELTGGKLMEGFGMSELAVASHCNPYRGANKLGSIGMPLPDVECRIVSLDDSTTDVPVGEVGELIIRSPSLMLGYHEMPTETANAIRDGWLYTGDIARMDEEGYFYIVDRKKDMVLIGGFNVYPNHVEKVLMEHDDIIEAGVAGIPHPKKEGQEALKAWVVTREGANLTSDEIIEFCREDLAEYEVPRRIEFVKELPKSTVGKVLRRELVKMEAS